MAAMRYRFLLFLVLAPCTPALAGGDDCERDPAKLIDHREGLNSVRLEFGFESRVEKYSSYAFRYLWCVVNKSTEIPAFFRWGTRNEPSKYFDSLLRPTQMKPNWRTDGSGTAIDKRIITFRPVNSNLNDWSSIEPETIFFRNIGLSSPINDQESHLQTAQISIEERLQNFKTEAGLVDLEKLSEDSELFRQYLSRENGKIAFTFSSTITIPVNSRTLESVEAGKYEKYSPQDFASLQLRLYNYIQFKDRSEPVSTIYVLSLPATDSDARLLEGSLELPLSIRIAGSEGPNPLRELNFGDRAGRTLNKLLLERPVTKLSYADVTIQVQNDKSSFRYFTMPVRVLFPAEKRT
jgi:hypothetical protein